MNSSIDPLKMVDCAIVKYAMIHDTAVLNLNLFIPMDEHDHNETIMAVLTNNTDYEKIKEKFGDDVNETKYYNKRILEILKLTDTSESFPLKLEPIVEANASSPTNRESIIESQGNGSQTIKAFLNDFYQIEYCPSFLLHGAMLEKEDFDFLIEIYSNECGLRCNPNDDCGRYMQESLIKYVNKVIGACKDKMDEKSFRDVVE